MKKTLLISTALLAVATGAWFGLTLLAPTPAEAKKVEFSLPDVHGQVHQLSEWKDKVVVLNFWATWCPPCLAEIPAFIELQKRYGGRGIQFVGVAVDSPESVIEFYKEEGMNYPVLVGEDEGLNIMAGLGNRDGSIPFSIILDRQGKTVTRKLGAFSLPELENILKPYATPAS
jgi:thiol-disulfide isomerase/thioredoxin